MAPEILSRIHEGRLEQRIFGAQTELRAIFDEMKAAYSARLETGRFSAAKERRDLHQAFLDAAAQMGVRAKDAERMFRSWF
jgi:hypothetical protein